MDQIKSFSEDITTNGEAPAKADTKIKPFSEDIAVTGEAPAKAENELKSFSEGISTGTQKYYEPVPSGLANALLGKIYPNEEVIPGRKKYTAKDIKEIHKEILDVIKNASRDLKKDLAFIEEKKLTGILFDDSGDAFLYSSVDENVWPFWHEENRFREDQGAMDWKDWVEERLKY